MSVAQTQHHAGSRRHLRIVFSGTSPSGFLLSGTVHSATAIIKIFSMDLYDFPARKEALQNDSGLLILASRRFGTSGLPIGCFEHDAVRDEEVHIAGGNENANFLARLCSTKV